LYFAGLTSYGFSAPESGQSKGSSSFSLYDDNSYSSIPSPVKSEALIFLAFD